MTPVSLSWPLSWLLPDIESEEEDHDDAEHGAAVQPRHDPPVTAVQCQVPSEGEVQCSVKHHKDDKITWPLGAPSDCCSPPVRRPG